MPRTSILICNRLLYRFKYNTIEFWFHSHFNVFILSTGASETFLQIGKLKKSDESDLVSRVSIWSTPAALLPKIAAQIWMRCLAKGVVFLCPANADSCVTFFSKANARHSLLHFISMAITHTQTLQKWTLPSSKFLTINATTWYPWLKHDYPPVSLI